MKIVIIISLLALTSCTRELMTVEEADKGCTTHGGVAYFHQFKRVLCNDGLEIR